MLFSIWDLEIVLLLKPSWLRLRAATAAAAIWRPSLSLILLRSKCYGILAPISGNLTSYAQWWSLKARITVYLNWKQIHVTFSFIATWWLQLNSFFQLALLCNTYPHCLTVTRMLEIIVNRTFELSAFMLKLMRWIRTILRIYFVL